MIYPQTNSFAVGGQTRKPAGPPSASIGESKGGAAGANNRRAPLLPEFDCILSIRGSEVNV